MKRNRRELIRNLVALVLLAALVGFAAWHRKRSFQAEEKKESEKKLVQVDLDDIDRIEIRNEPGQVVFERRVTDKNGKYTDEWAPLSYEFDSIPEWRIVEPVSFLPDFYTMKTLLENLDDFSWKKIIQEKGERAGDYGLEEPAVTLSLATDKENEKKGEILRIGEENPGGDGLYVQTSKSPRIFLADYSLNYLKTRSFNDWRKKEVLGLKDLGKVKKLIMVYYGKGQAGMTEMKKKEGIWQITKPKRLPADAKAVEGLLSDLKSIRVNKFISEDATKDSKAYGFSKPYASFSLVFDAEDGEQKRTLLIGSKIEQGKDIYVRRLDFPQIFSVRSSLKDSLSKEMSDLVEKRLFPWAKEDLTLIVAQYDNSVVELRKDGDRWKLIRPREEELKAEQIDLLLNKLNSFKAKEYLGDKLPEEAGELEMVLTVETEDEKREVVFHRTKDEEKRIGVLAKPTMAYQFVKLDMDVMRERLNELRDKPKEEKKVEREVTGSIEKGEEE